jgi:hypothetical protein
LASPLITVALARADPEEKRIYRWSAVAIDFVGVIVMLVPHFEPAYYVGVAAGAAALGSTLALASPTARLPLDLGKPLPSLRTCSIARSLPRIRVPARQAPRRHWEINFETPRSIRAVLDVVVNEFGPRRARFDMMGNLRVEETRTFDRDKAI